MGIHRAVIVTKYNHHHQLSSFGENIFKLHLQNWDNYIKMKYSFEPSAFVGPLCSCNLLSPSEWPVRIEPGYTKILGHSSSWLSPLRHNIMLQHPPTVTHSQQDIIIFTTITLYTTSCLFVLIINKIHFWGRNSFQESIELYFY